MPDTWVLKQQQPSKNYETKTKPTIFEQTHVESKKLDFIKKIKSFAHATTMKLIYSKKISDVATKARTFEQIVTEPKKDFMKIFLKFSKSSLKLEGTSLALATLIKIVYSTG